MLRKSELRLELLAFNGPWDSSEADWRNSACSGCVPQILHSAAASALSFPSALVPARTA